MHRYSTKLKLGIAASSLGTDTEELQFAEMHRPVLLLQAIFLLTHASTPDQYVWPANKIVGGSPISITIVPYMLSVLLDKRYICSAGIVNSEWAVTAAHCAKGFRSWIKPPRRRQLSVRSGSDYWQNGGTEHVVKEVVVHEKFDGPSGDYDISLLRVEPKFVFDETTQPLLLAGGNGSWVRTDWGLVAGWGYRSTNGPELSPVLEFVFLPRIRREECMRDYAGKYNITPRQVCYGFRAGGRDACKGDSGAPLVNGKILIGVTSWGDKCAEPFTPGVYTDAVLLADWIRNNTPETVAPDDGYSHNLSVLRTSAGCIQNVIARIQKFLSTVQLWINTAGLLFRLVTCFIESTSSTAMV